MSIPTLVKEISAPVITDSTDVKETSASEFHPRSFVPVAQRRHLGDHPLWQEYLAEIKALRDADLAEAAES